MIHSEIMFLEIMNLYAIFTDYVELELDILKEAFYELQDIITDNIKTIHYNFEEELDNLVTRYGSMFELTENTLILQSDIDEAYEKLDQQLDGGITAYDDCLYHLVQNIHIFHILDIPDPSAQYESFWQLNKSILAYHVLLAQKENIAGKIDQKDLNMLAMHVNQLRDMISEINARDDIFMRAALEFQKEEEILNPDWYVALFENHPFKSVILNHSKVAYYLDSNFLKIQADENSKGDNYYTCDTDRDYFLSYFIIILDRLIQKLYTNGEINKILNIRKHLLIAITPPMEQAYMEHGKLDGTLKILDVEKNSKQAFLSFYPTVLERINDLNCLDMQLNVNKISSMILSAIFIRTFLDTCMNEVAVQEVYQQIKNAKWFNNPNYYYATLFTQTIILSGDEADIQKKR